MILLHQGLIDAQPFMTLKNQITGLILSEFQASVYLNRLETLYQNWIASYDKSKILVIENDRLNYVNDLIDQIELLQSIEALLPKDLSRS